MVKSRSFSLFFHGDALSLDIPIPVKSKVTLSINTSTYKRRGIFLSQTLFLEMDRSEIISFLYHQHSRKLKTQWFCVNPGKFFTSRHPPLCFPLTQLSYRAARKVAQRFIFRQRTLSFKRVRDSSIIRLHILQDKGCFSTHSLSTLENWSLLHWRAISTACISHVIC